MLRSTRNPLPTIPSSLPRVEAYVGSEHSLDDEKSWKVVLFSPEVGARAPPAFLLIILCPGTWSLNASWREARGEA